MANTRLYVGNLPYSVTSDQLQTIFSEFGEVSEATVISDKHSGRSKGFGFVEYASEEAANKAVEAKNGQEIDGRPLVVNIARPMQPRPNFQNQNDQ